MGKLQYEREDCDENGFAKIEKNGEEIVLEGYVGGIDKEFNGVIFYMREPNTDGKPAEEFWFKKIVHNQNGYYQKLEEDNPGVSYSTGKRAATKYKNRFSEILEVIGKKGELEKTIYCNLHSYKGLPQASDEYKKKIKRDIAMEKIEKIIKNVKSEKLEEIYIFACSDIYMRLREKCLIKEGDEIVSGLMQGAKRRKYFEGKIENKKVRVYDMHHPAHSPKVDVEKSKA